MTTTAISVGKRSAPDAAGDALIPEIPVGRTLAAEALRLPTLIAVAVMTILVILPFFRAAALPIVVGFMPNIWNLMEWNAINPTGI